MSSVLPDVIAAVMLVALVLYAVLGGADFGGGVWDLAAFGPRAKQQRETIEHSIAPVWEANHVWLILIVVLLFTAFPLAWATASILLHIPLTAMLIGVVLRGSAFVFRKYDLPGPAERTWGRVFAAGSVIAPFFLGVCLAAISSGHLTNRDIGESYAQRYVWPWLGAFPVLVGSFVLVLFAFVAAVYLTVEADTQQLQDDFRRRALGSGVVAAVLAIAAALAGPKVRLPELPLLIGAALAAAGFTTHALLTRAYRRARVSTVALVAVFIGGWAFGMYPNLINPGFDLHTSAAPEATLKLLVWALAAGVLVLAPSLYALFKVFKRQSLPAQLDPNHQPKA
ncbi:MAG: cytochrome d ubiquinol oxidase subunit II [Myxococcaceae bacterium]